MRTERRASACCKKYPPVGGARKTVKEYKESQAAFFCLAFTVRYSCLLYIRVPCNKYALDSLGKSEVEGVLWLPCRRAETEAYSVDLPPCIDCFVYQCLCRVRRLDAPLTP